MIRGATERCEHRETSWIEVPSTVSCAHTEAGCFVRRVTRPEPGLDEARAGGLMSRHSPRDAMGSAYLLVG